jgi:hypothetical protein
VRILYAVQYDDERSSGIGGCEIGKRRLTSVVELCGDTLVDAAPAFTIQNGSLNALDGDAACCREIQELADPCVRARPDSHATHASGSKGFAD